MSKRKWKAWGILNSAGDLWTTQVFDSAEEAQEHIDEMKGKFDWSLDRHKPTEVEVSVRALKI